MILSLKIALRFHKSFKRNILISLASLITIVIIITGIAVSIIVLSVVNGFKYELDKRILSIIPHGEIFLINNSIFGWKKILNHIQKIPNIININPYIHLSGVIEYCNKWHLIYIKSINLSENSNLYNNVLTKFIDKNSWNYFCQNKNQIILGQGVSVALDIKSGDWITIILSNDLYLKNKKILSPKKIRMQVSGILQLHSQLDDNIAIISLSDAQSYCNNRTDIDGIEFSVNNVFKIHQIIQKIKNQIHKDIKIRSWMDTYGYVYRDIQIIRMIIYSAIILIIGISCCSIVTALLLSIKNKYYDISVLKALGAQNTLIQNIFLWYGFIIYCVSCVLGIGTGVFISLILSNIGANYIKIFGSDFSMRETYFIDFIPIKLNNMDVLTILITVLILGFLVSWISSLRAKKMDLSRILN